MFLQGPVIFFIWSREQFGGHARVVRFRRRRRGGRIDIRHSVTRGQRGAVWFLGRQQEDRFSHQEERRRLQDAARDVPHPPFPYGLQRGLGNTLQQQSPIFVAADEQEVSLEYETI